MKIKGKNDVQDIQSKEIVKKCVVGRQEINFYIQNAFTGKVNGQEEVLDEILIDNMIEQMARAIKVNNSSYYPIPDEVIIRKKVADESAKQDTEKKTSDKMIESYEPRFSLEQVALNQEVKRQIKTAISAVKYKSKMTNEWGMSEYFAGNRAIILNFYGKPGTGKSMAAEAVSTALGKKVYHINYSELESKYVGETPKNIRRAFESATRDDAVLIFDEADSFLGKRLTSVTQSADYGVNITRSVLLMELEKFAGVVVFTTNLINNYDEAFKRRILLSVYFDMPDEQARTEIWKLHLNEKIPLDKEVTAEGLAGRYDGISGADIKDMVFYGALYTLEQEKNMMDFSDFDYAYATIKGRYANRGSEAEFQVVSAETITEEEYRKEIAEEV